MPEIGDIKKGQEIGKTRGVTFIWHACKRCGKERWVELVKSKPAHSLCSSHHGRCANTNPNWKGGKVKSEQYFAIKLQPDDFFFPMAGQNSYVLEHRLIMAKHLGRCLLPWEIIHHKNGMRGDNRLENLRLLPTQTYHIADTQMKRYILSLEKQIQKLKARIVLLEAGIAILGCRIENKPVMAVTTR